MKSTKDGEQSLSADAVTNLDTAYSPKEDGNVDSVYDLQEVQGTLNSSVYADSNSDNESGLLAVNKRLQCVHSEVGIGSLSVWDINNDDEDDDRDCIDVTSYPQSLEYEVVSPEETPSYVQAEEEGDEEDMQNLENSDQVHQGAQLYSHAPITTMCSRVILMKFIMKHRITQEALADLLQVLQLHLPSPNNAPSTLYHFRKEFKDLQYPLIYHHFCNKCLMPASMETEVCENILCKSSFSERHSNFIEIPIHLQLQCILERKHTYLL